MTAVTESLNNSSHKNPLVSVIVPTKNSAEFLEACLHSIKEQTYQNLEIIVVDNNSTDTTKNIAHKYTSKVFNKGPERSAQRNYGVKQALGAYVLIIDSDMELTKDVISFSVSKALSTDTIRAIIIPEESFGTGFWSQCKKLERSFYVGVDFMEGARFFNRRTFDEIGGYDEQNTGSEDYDLPQRLEAKYGPASIGRVTSFIRHNEMQLNLLKTCKKKYYYTRSLEYYKAVPANLQNFKKQSSVVSRYGLFFKNPSKLFNKPTYGVGMIFLKSCEFFAAWLGYAFKRKKETYGTR